MARTTSGTLTIWIAGYQSIRTVGFSVYTRKRRPVTLVWSDTFATRDEAFAVERQLKGWSRAKKEALIKGNWTRLRTLARQM